MTDAPAHPSHSGRLANGRFAPGHPGGRRVGSRNRASHKVVMAILADFQANQAELLHRLRRSYTPSYFNTLARLASPMLAEAGSDFSDCSDAEAARVVSHAQRVLAITGDPRQALAELEAILAGDPPSTEGP